MKPVSPSGDIPYVSRVAWCVAGALYVIRVCEFAAVTWWQIFLPLVFAGVFLGVAHYVVTALDFSIKKLEDKRQKLISHLAVMVRERD